jgi:putative DNA primase/helicase
MNIADREFTKTLAHFIRADEPVELRFLGVERPDRVHAGWITLADADAVASKVSQLAAVADGVYFTPQRLKPEVLSRAARGHFGNVVRPNKKGAETKPKLTHDDDVAERQYLIIDVDPKRPELFKNHSTTDVEKSAAWTVLGRVREFLKSQGWADPLLIDSGNGYHGYYVLPAPESGGPSAADDSLVVLLRCLAARFNTNATDIDTTVANSSRIMKLPGTWARKGPDLPDRPHRQSKVLEIPDDWRNAGLSKARPIAEVIGELDASGKIRKPTPVAGVAVAADLPSDDIRVVRAAAYLANMPAGIQGQNGSGATYAAACAAVHGFALGTDLGYQVLASAFNPRCVPEWSEAELRHKCEDAANKTHQESAGYLLGRGQTEELHKQVDPNWLIAMQGKSAASAKPTLPAQPSDEVAPAKTIEEEFLGEADDDPHRLARVFLGGYSHDGKRTLSFWRGEFYEWISGCWFKVDEKTIHGRVNLAARREFVRLQREYRIAANANNTELPKMAKVTRSLVGNVVAALEGITIIEGVEVCPSWIPPHTGPNTLELVATKGGLVCLPSFAVGADGSVRPVDPWYFNTSSLDFKVSAKSPEPTNWLAFLDKLWPDDPESIALLQEWFGYLLTPDNSQQKILWMFGPTRAGKGVICDVIKALMGKGGYSSTSLVDMAKEFTMSNLIGASATIVEDLRNHAKSDEPVILSRLLTISGGGEVAVNRKGLPIVNVKLGTRFVIASNDLPGFRDDSNAISARWSMLRLVNSFLGKEDLTLTERLMSELPSIFLWAVKGWQRLKLNGKFTVPASSESLRNIVRESTSPIGVFISERCRVEDRLQVAKNDLYNEYCEYCERSGITKPLTKIGFGRQLFVAVRNLGDKTIRQGGEVFDVYTNIALASSLDNVSLWPEQSQQANSDDASIPALSAGEEL